MDIDSKSTNKNICKEDLTSDIELVSKSFGTSTQPFMGPSYILPNGKFLKIRNANINISSNGSGDRGLIIHLDVQKWLNKQHNKEVSNIDSIDLEEVCIRVNTDMVEHYIVLPKQRPNDNQFEALKDWIDFYFEKRNTNLTLVSYYGPTETYFVGTVAEDIIDDIKAYYTRGMYFESKSCTKDKPIVIKEDYTPTEEDFPFTLDDIENEFPDLFSSNFESCGNAFITPDGRFILSGKRFDMHADFSWQCLMNIAGKTEQEIETEWDTSKLLDAFTKYFDLVRVNDGSNKGSEERVYFVIPKNRLSRGQYDALLSWLDYILENKFSKKIYDIQAFVGNNYAHKRWDISNDITSDEIMEDVEGALIRGYFTESLKEEVSESDQEILNILDETFGQGDRIVDWSTYILPNGHCLDFWSDCINDKYLSDSPEEWFTEDEGEHARCWEFMNAMWPDKFESSIECEEFMDKYCIKVNINYPYASLATNNVTSQQWNSLEKIMNCLLEHPIDYYWMECPNDEKGMVSILTKKGDTWLNLFELGLEEFMKEVKEGYTRGFFENLDEYFDEVGFEETNEEFPVFASDEPYRIKTLITKGDKAYRIYYDKSTGTFYLQDAFGNRTHGDMLDLAKENGWITDQSSLGKYLDTDWDGYMVFIPFNYDKELRWHTRIGEDDYYDCRVYPYGVMFVRDDKAYENPLFSALGEPEREIHYKESNETITISVGDKSYDLDVWDDLGAEPNDAISLDLDSLGKKKKDHNKFEYVLDMVKSLGFKVANSERRYEQKEYINFANRFYDEYQLVRDIDKDEPWTLKDEEGNVLNDSLDFNDSDNWNVISSLQDAKDDGIDDIDDDLLDLDDLDYDDIERESLDEGVDKYYRLELEDPWGGRSGLILGAFEMIPTKETIEEFPEDFEELTDDERRTYYEIDRIISKLSEIKCPAVNSKNIFAFTKEAYNKYKEDIKYLQELVSKIGMKVIINEVDVDDLDIEYKDDDQIAFDVRKYNPREITESKQDIEKFKQWAGEKLANRFFAIKDRIKDNDKDMRDIYWWMTQANKFFGDDEQVLKQLKDFVKELESIPTKKERNKNAREGSEKVYDDGRWLVLKINTYEASVKYGKGTEWCITGTNSSDDEGNGGRYDFGKHSKGAQIYFYIDRSKNNKYALEFKDLHNWCLWNESDWVECGEGKLFKQGLDVQSGETWNAYDSGGKHPNFPNIQGLPDLNKAYEDLAKEQGWDKPIILEEIEKTFKFPNTPTMQRALQSLEKDGYKLETIRIEDLVKDNNLLDNKELDYHKAIWGPNPDDYRMDDMEIDSWNFNDAMSCVRKDNKLLLNNGKHRTRALYNSGYEFIEIPVLSESLNESNKELDYIHEMDGDYVDMKELENVTYKQLVDNDLVINPTNKLYHSTPASNLESIKQNGLRIDNKNLWSMSKSGRIYFALDPDESIEYTEYAYQWGASNVEDVILLEVPIDALDLNKLYVDTNEDENGYCIEGKLCLMSLEYRDNVPASSIKIVKIIKEDEMDESLKEKIVKKGNKWQVQSEKGKNLGTYDTKKEAEDRLKQVHYFKHMNEFIDEVPTKYSEETITDELSEVKRLLNKGNVSYRGCYDTKDNVVGLSELELEIHDNVERAMVKNGYSSNFLHRFLVFDKKYYDENSIDDEVDYYDIPLEQYEYDNFYLVWVVEKGKSFTKTELYNVLGKPIKKLRYIKESFKEDLKDNQVVYNFDRELNSNEVLLYHQTSEDKLKKILKDGFIKHDVWAQENIDTWNYGGYAIGFAIDKDRVHKPNDIDRIVYVDIPKEDFVCILDSRGRTSIGKEKFKSEFELVESKEDFEKFKVWCNDDNLYNRFMKLRNRLNGQEKDIYYWMGLEKKYGKHGAIQELLITLRDLERTPTRKEKDELAKEGSILLYNQNGWKVYKIETQEASQKYGKNTMWCISGEGGYDIGDGFWEGHEDNTYFYIHGNEKYALIWPKGAKVWDIWNDEDEIIPYIPNAPKVEGLPDVSKLPDFITTNVAKLYNISVDDIKDVKSASYDSELMDLFLDYDSKQNYIVELKDGTTKYCYVKEFTDFIDVTEEIEELIDEYL